MLIVLVSENLHIHISVVHAYLAQMGSNHYYNTDSQYSNNVKDIVQNNISFYDTEIFLTLPTLFSTRCHCNIPLNQDLQRKSSTELFPSLCSF